MMEASGSFPQHQGIPPEIENSKKEWKVGIALFRQGHYSFSTARVNHRPSPPSTAAQPASVKKLLASVCGCMQSGSRLGQNHPLPQQTAKTKDNGTTDPPTSQTLPFTSDASIAADRSILQMRKNKRFLPPKKLHQPTPSPSPSWRRPHDHFLQSPRLPSGRLQSHHQPILPDAQWHLITAYGSRLGSQASTHNSLHV